MKTVYVVISNGDDGVDQIEKIFANVSAAQRFADTLTFPGIDVSVIKMEVN
jgi:hypothetical protein